MNIPLTILTHQVTSGRGIRGGDKGPKDEGFDPTIFGMGLLVCLPILVMLAIIIDDYTSIRAPKYEVDGTVVQYVNQTSGKTKKVFVDLQQTDGIVRRYNTNITPNACQPSPLGTHIPVIVASRYSRWWKIWSYTTVMKYNPCLK